MKNTSTEQTLVMGSFLFVAQTNGFPLSNKSYPKASLIVALFRYVKHKCFEVRAGKHFLVYSALLITIMLSATRIIATGARSSPDSEIYSLAGWSYVQGQSPERLNFEHPPLAKYLIGISETVFGSEMVFSLVFGALTLLAVYFLSKRILPSYFALLPSALIALDRLFLWSSSVLFLDIYATFFVTMYTSLFLRFRDAKWLWAPLGFTIGLAIASKWSGAFALPALVAFGVIEKDKNAIRSLLLSLPLAALTYMSTYGVFFLSGHSLQDFISLQFQMLSYQTNLRFGKGTPPAFWLWFSVLTGIEGRGMMSKVTSASGLQTTSMQYGVAMQDTFNPLTWPLSLVDTILSLVFARKGRYRVGLFPAFAFLSFLGMMSYGQLFIWYLLPALPFAFISLSYMLWRLYASTGGTTRATIVLAGYVIATFLWSFFGQMPAFIVTR